MLTCLLDLFLQQHALIRWHSVHVNKRFAFRRGCAICVGVWCDMWCLECTLEKSNVWQDGIDHRLVVECHCNDNITKLNASCWALVRMCSTIRFFAAANNTSATRTRKHGLTLRTRARTRTSTNNKTRKTHTPHTRAASAFLVFCSTMLEGNLHRQVLQWEGTPSIQLQRKKFSSLVWHS